MLSYFADNMWQAWLIVSIVCLILELTNGDFFIFCFAVGGLGGMITSWIIDSTMWQVIIFAAVSVLSLFFVRPVMLKYFHKKDHDRKSNYEALIGRVGTVTDAIPADGYGYVKIDGDSWKAHTDNGQQAAVGEKVEVLEMNSIILTVKKI
ncbi:NfeD family protein [Prevotella lacticifex]|uniref:DUF107 domain-containing protein n=1 Tax=Prevotella lacticifex TaxID=2854755 RepID=A0A9R1CWN2_9BACT|nr:NfeD family protein [Prevotella lacticifex]GJG35701.1 DUF107 domain-containing protein [Prevotella lacticifex]GJG39250.1 DUF107 domain-containing protein [Prevotella lacticifex]GJG42070.1 DUF107 domain-containing protein [Prevotella lacticifex]GJG45604.1 DUF107 domain-containing protein [Prevotella lacticifex]GJG48421.1 DUF107 domain-containing protein [Prevotella lacticifex]